MIGLLSRLGKRFWDISISLDRVIWIERMARSLPRGIGRSLYVGEPTLGREDLLHMTRFGRTRGGSSAPSFLVRRSAYRSPDGADHPRSSNTVSGTLPGH
jgi:hypothetical protein